MDPDIVKQVNASNQAAIALVTLLVSEEAADVEAISMVVSDPAYRDPATSMAIATLAVSAIKTIADILECDPMEIVQVAGLSAAEFGIMLEKKIEEN